MPKKKIEKEDQIIDLLEKLIIIELIKENVKRDDIKRILGIGGDKISNIQKYMSKENKNG